MLIREALESDAIGIAQVVKQISEIKSVAGEAVEEVRDCIAQGLARALKSQTSLVLVGLDEDGAIAGYCAVHWVPFLFLRGGEGYITELFIRPGNRNRGLGSALLREVGQRAGERGCSRLSLLNGRDSEAYKSQFYKHRNWSEREKMANFILPLRS